MRKRHAKSSHEDAVKTVKIQRLAAESLEPELLKQLYKLVLKLRPLYLAAGDRWDRKTKLDEMKNTEGLTYQIAVSGTTVLGFISYVLEQDLPGLMHPPVTFIWELHVSPVAKRQGLGKRLIELVAAETEKPVMLRTFPCNKYALRFYEKMGFAVDESLSDHISLIMASTRN